MTIQSSESIEERNIQLVRDMFDSAIRMDADAIDHQLSREFEMVSNDVTWDFQTYKDFHVETYKHRRGIEITIADIFCKGDRVAARVEIRLLEADGSAKDLQVMLIVQIKDDRIYRLWELTFPHWI